jgi:hypothetical protein
MSRIGLRTDCTNSFARGSLILRLRKRLSQPIGSARTNVMKVQILSELA